MAVQLTEAAARHVQKMLEKRGAGVGLRLGTRVSGCTGFAYVVDYADEIGAEDHTYASHAKALIANFLVIVATGFLAFLNRAVDVVVGHILGPSGLDGRPQPRIHCRIRHPQFCRRCYFPREFGKHFRALLILSSLSELDILEFGMACHGLIPSRFPLFRSSVWVFSRAVLGD